MVVKPVVELIKCSLCLQKDIVPKEEIYYRVSVFFINWTDLTVHWLFIFSVMIAAVSNRCWW